MKQKYCIWVVKKRIIYFLFTIFFLLFFIFWNSYAVSIKQEVAKVIIQITLENINKMKDNLWINISVDNLWLPNYNNYYQYLFTYFWKKQEYKQRLNNIIPFKYILTDYVVWLHYREHWNDISTNPNNGDWLFQLYRIWSILKWNQNVYFTPPNMYNQIYKTCTYINKCNDFSKNLIYEYWDFAWYIAHKFTYMNIIKKAIYWTYFNWRQIKWLKQILSSKMDIDIDDNLWNIFIKSYYNYLNKNNLKIDNLLHINFEFISNSYNIKDYNQFIDLLYNKYWFKSYWVWKDFIKTLLNTFQLSVIGAYYNGLWNVQGSWIYMWYTFNFPASFTNKIWVISPYTFKKISWHWYLVKDAQIWSVVYYFYTKESSFFKNIVLMKKLLF